MHDYIFTFVAPYDPLGSVRRSITISARDFQAAMSAFRILHPNAERLAINTVY